MINTRDAENKKFIELDNNTYAVRVGGTGSIISGIQFDEIQATYPANDTEIYQYLLGSNVVATITVIYTNSSKNELQSVSRS